MPHDLGATVASAEPTAAGIAFTAPSTVWAVLGRLGRTEDVRFSPDNRRLAIAAFTSRLIALVDVDLTTGPSGPVITLTRAREMVADGLADPHGVDFLDDDTILVANRDGRVTIHRIPDDDPTREPSTPIAMPTLLDDDLGGIITPGSVRVTRDATGTVALVCDNYIGMVTRHRVTMSGAVPHLAPAEVVVRRWLDIPDSVATSPDGRWLAVSNHNLQTVLVYDRTSGLDPHSEPVAVLRGVVYPHGLHFSPDGRILVVADAGRPLVHVFAAAEGGWHGTDHPVGSHRVMDEITFLRGNAVPQEGGPKGLDVDRTGRIVAVTSEHQPLAFFDLAALVADPGSAGPARRLDYERTMLEREEARRRILEHTTQRADTAEARAAATIRIAAAAEARADAAEARADAAEARADASERSRLVRTTRAVRRRFGAFRSRTSTPTDTPTPTDERRTH